MHNIKNKSKVAIVVVGFNRLYSINRLLKSLLKANYDSSDIPLVISLDKSDDYNLYSYVNNFVWPHGEKYVIIKTSRLGLKEHILQCGNLTKYFRAIILLEDDIYVSTEFYRYVIAVLDKYCDDPIIAGISLFSDDWNGYLQIPFIALKNGSDVFLAQAVSSWGQCWTDSMWNSFILWYQNTTTEFIKIDMLDEIKNWKNAWSVDFYVYMILLDKYFLFPHESLTTNFSEVGTHGIRPTTDYQVNLLAGGKKYEFYPSYNLVKYDVYSNNIDLYKYLDIPKDNLCVDLYGNNPNNYSKRYWLTPLYKPYKVIKSYGLYLRPHELNVIDNIEGNDIFLYDTSINSNTVRKHGANIAFLEYHIKEYPIKMLLYISFIRYKRVVLKRLKISKKIIFLRKSFRKERLFEKIIKNITAIFIKY